MRQAHQIVCKPIEEKLGPKFEESWTEARWGKLRLFSLEKRKLGSQETGQEVTVQNRQTHVWI